MDLDRGAGALARVCRRLAAAGLAPGGSGNVSLRVGGQALITPTGSALSRVEPADLTVIGLADGRPVAGRSPSKELPLHLAVLRSTTAGAVVHLHAPAMTAIACLPPDAAGRATLPAFTPYRVLRLGDVPLVPYAAPGSTALAEGVLAAAASPVLLLAAHGCVVSAADLDSAADLAEELENAASVTLLLRGTAATLLSPAQVAELTGRA